MNEKWKDFTAHMTKVGTPECAIFSGVVAMVAALLFLLAGFWQTLLIAAIVLVGVFIGGVKDKKEWLRHIVNKLFPVRENAPYKADDAHINIHPEQNADKPEHSEENK